MSDELSSTSLWWWLRNEGQEEGKFSSSKLEAWLTARFPLLSLLSQAECYHHVNENVFHRGQTFPRQPRKLQEHEMRLKSTAVLCHSQLWRRNPSALLLAGTRSCASSSGGPVSSKQNQRELVPSPAFLQSHHQALPLERWPALWWPLPISAAVWISGSSEQSGAAAEIRKYIYFFPLGFVMVLFSLWDVNSWDLPNEGEIREGDTEGFEN